MKLNILVDEHPILRKKAQVIENFSVGKYEKLIKDMTETMQKADGIGLAAPQIGESIRLIIVDIGDGPLTLINPEIKKHSKEMEPGEEGCLSVPGHYQNVNRYKWINYEAVNKDGKKISERAEGLLARVLQHEIDHLEGILIIDK